MTVIEDPPTATVAAGDERHGPGTGLWIAAVVVALLLGGAVGWRVGVADDDTSPPAADSLDVGFFQDMVTHHNQALAMSRVYLDHGTDPLLRQIAGEIADYQASEIGVMNEHLSLWGRLGSVPPIAMRWMGMATPRDEMFGLATPAEMQQLRDARGPELDQLFTRLMIVHHAAGVHMADYAAEHGTTATVRRWGAAMADGQRGEIAELNRWRVTHGLGAVDPGIAPEPPQSDE
jgi:uncharacterized protein (DUF305 family)